MAGAVRSHAALCSRANPAVSSRAIWTGSREGAKHPGTTAAPGAGSGVRATVTVPLVGQIGRLRTRCGRLKYGWLLHHRPVVAGRRPHSGTLSGPGRSGRPDGDITTPWSSADAGAGRIEASAKRPARPSDSRFTGAAVPPALRSAARSAGDGPARSPAAPWRSAPRQ
jgi:hypothetical protein